MPSVADQLPRGGRVLIIRLRSLGDCVLTTPAIALLHEYRPDLSIAVMADRPFRPVFEGNPAVAVLPEPTVAEALGFRPHLTLNFHGGTRSMQLTAASLARWRAGFAHHSFSLIYNVPIPRAQEILEEERTVHTAEHLASAMFHLGVPRSEIPRAQLFAVERNGEGAEPYCLIHPFAALPEKTWPAERFVRLAGHIRDRMGLMPVFLGAPGDDFAPFVEFECLRGAPLAQVKQKLSRASLFVGNDSGPAHMAAAFGLPVLVMFGPSDDVVWRPWQTAYELLKAEGNCDRIPYEDAVAALARLEVKA
ncbi:MAG TPA: glycosyltransferase family 9 protein [Bryobacteraceae bacterium]|nr:glycosyltransferase family 9 protein [Bryobacteraceae bacterium]